MHNSLQGVACSSLSFASGDQSAKDSESIGACTEPITVLYENIDTSQKYDRVSSDGRKWGGEEAPIHPAVYSRATMTHSGQSIFVPH